MAPLHEGDAQALEVGQNKLLVRLIRMIEELAQRRHTLGIKGSGEVMIAKKRDYPSGEQLFK